MATKLGARKRNGSELVYRNDRLLIGWRTRKTLQSEATSATLHRTEAWLGQMTPEEVAGDHKSDHVAAIGLLRVYVSPYSPDQMYRDVMGVDEPHPAILDPHVDTTEVASFLERGAIRRLKFVNRRFTAIKSGTRKYCESEGGKLKRFARNAGDVADDETEDDEADKSDIDDSDLEDGEIREQMKKKKAEQREKRKRDSANFNSPHSYGGGGKRRRSEPAVATRKEDVDDDGGGDEDPISPRNEEPADSCLMSRGIVVHQSINDADDVVREISPGIASMTVGEATPKETTQFAKHEGRAEQTEPLTLMESARALAKEVKRQAETLAELGKHQNADLTGHFSALASANTVEEIIKLSKEVYARVDHIRKILTLHFIDYEPVVKNAEARRKADDVLARLKETALEYKAEEVNARKIYLALRTQTEDLETRRVFERYAPKQR
jgi:hypothetical protein